MTNELLTAYIKLTPTVEGIQGAAAKALRPASSEGDKAGRSAGQRFGASFSKQMRRAVGIAAGLIAFKSLKSLISSTTTEFLDLTTATRGLQRITGGSIEEVSGLRGAMQLAGVDITKVNGALTIFGKGLSKAADDSKKQAIYNKLLGDTWKTADGQVRPLTELLPKLSDQFEKMPDGAQKTALATQLFGRSGAALLPYLSQGSRGVAALTDKAQELGLVLDNGSVEKMSEYREASRRWDATLQGLKITIGQALLPVLTTFVTTLTDSVAPAISGVRDLVTANSGFLADLASEVSTSFDRIATVVDRVRDFKNIIGQLDGAEIDGAALGQSIGEAIRSAFDTNSGILKVVATKLAETFQGVDFVGIGIELGKQVPAMLIGLAAGILTFDLGSLLSGLADHWGTILLAVISLALAPARIVGGLAKYLARIPFAGKFLSWLVLGISKIGTKIKGVAGSAIKEFASGFRSALGFTGPLLIVRLIGMLRGLFPRIAAWGSQLAGKLKFQIQYAALRMGEAAGRAFLAVIRFFIRLPGRILRAVGRLGSILAAPGRQLMSGLGSAISSRIGSVVSFVRRIPGRIKSAISNPRGLLKGVGGNIIDGLITGISKSSAAIRRAIGNVGAAIKKKIKSMFGINSPSRWMRDQIGKQLVAGMAVGLLAATPLLVRQLDALQIAPTVDPFDIGSTSTAAAARANSADAAVPRATDRPIYTDTGVLLGWIREEAGKQARLIWNDQAEYDAAGNRRR